MCFLIRANGEVHSSGPVVLKTLMYQYHLKGLLKHRALSLTPRVSEMGRAEMKTELAFLTDFHMMLLLLIWDHILRITDVN